MEYAEGKKSPNEMEGMPLIEKGVILCFQTLLCSLALSLSLFLSSSNPTPIRMPRQ